MAYIHRYGDGKLTCIGSGCPFCDNKKLKKKNSAMQKVVDVAVSLSGVHQMPHIICRCCLCLAVDAYKKEVGE